MKRIRVFIDPLTLECTLVLVEGVGEFRNTVSKPSLALNQFTARAKLKGLANSDSELSAVAITLCL